MKETSERHTSSFPLVLAILVNAVAPACSSGDALTEGVAGTHSLTGIHLTATEDTGDTFAKTETAESAPSLTSTTSTTNITGTTSAQGEVSGSEESTVDSGMSPGETAAETSEGGGPVNFDMGSRPDAPEESVGCTKIDILFVIDDSGSMAKQQAKLLNSFSGFIEAIQTVFADHSYHVGVVTSDEYGFNAEGCRSLGDLVSQTGWGDCTPFAEGHRFATEQDDLTAKFPCMANVGTDGSPIEQPVTGLIAALDPAKALPGGCNEGFLRADAVLVVVVITDDPPHLPDFDDAHPEMDTSGWHAAVLAAKNNDPEAIVVIGFVPWNNRGDYNCAFGFPSPNLIEFVQSFGDQGVLASICENDYAPTFAASVATIVTTCELFPTPG